MSLYEYQQASQKVHALSSVCPYMNINKRRTIMKAFIESEFGYCPLVWMLHSCTLNTHIDIVDDRALRLAYNDYISTFSELLKLDNSFTVHERNIQTLAIELFKVVHNLSPEIMREVFILAANVKLTLQVQASLMTLHKYTNNLSPPDHGIVEMQIY